MGLATAGFSLYYNLRVAGDPFTIPYVHSRALYGVPQTFLFQKAREVDIAALPTAPQRKMYAWQLESHDGPRKQPVMFLFDKSVRVWMCVCGITLTLPAIFIWRVLQRKKDRAANMTLFAIVATNIAGVYAYGFFNTHYLAPSLAAIAALLTNGLRYVSAGSRTWWSRSVAQAYTGPTVVAVLVLCALAKMFLPVGANILARMPGAVGKRFGHLGIVTSYKAPEWAEFRDGIIRRASTNHDRRLILVRYSDSHDFGEEWVYNEPQPEQSAVVWARDLGAAENARLVRYFTGRSAWLLDADRRPLQLAPYQ